MKKASETTKTKSRRTPKKIFTNVVAILLCLVYFANVLAGEYSGQVNAFLGTSTTKTVSKDGSDTSDTEYTRYYESVYSSVAELKEAGLAKAQEVEAEGAVLLKNDNDVLPLAAGTDVSLLGATAISPVYGGTGSGAVSADDAPSYVDALTASGLNVIDQDLLDWYVDSEKLLVYDECYLNEASWQQIQKSDAVDTIGNGEVAIFVVGRVGGEANDLDVTGHDDGLDGDYLQLNKNERAVLEGLKEYKDEGLISSIIVIINSANPISMDFADDEAYGVDAILWIGSVGQTGLYAVGDILVGEVNPSGSLSDTWWVDNKLDPSVANFGSYTYEGADDYNLGSRVYTQYVVYQEGIYVGYRYTETRYEDLVMGTDNVGDYVYDEVVAYPFGYGLSYTTFEFSDMETTVSGEGQDTIYTVSVTVTNTGEVAGKKTVQIYAQKPYTEYDVEYEIEKASVELVGYGKTQTLEPGESETITVDITEYYLTSYDAYNTGVYILDEGTYYLTAAENSHAAVNNILAAKGYTTDDGMTEDGDASMVYSVDYEFDSETWSTSFGTGEEVTSLFADVDVNRYEGIGDNEVTYITRSDWEGTTMLWTADDDGENTNYVVLSMTDQIAADVVLDADDLPENDDDWPTMGSTDTSYQLIDLLEDEDGNEIAYDDPMWDSLLDQLTYSQLSKLAAVGLRMTVAIEEIGKPETLDHNGPSGVTQSYSTGSNGYAVQTNDPDASETGTCYPCNGIIAATFNDQLAEEVGKLIGEDCMWAGYAGLYGTGLNIHRTPYAGRVFEYYSEDSILTGLIGAAETAGIQSKGVYVYNKHFVLNDQEEQRQGIGTWCNEQALREIYLRAFELPIVYSDAKCVMTAFNRLGATWSGANSNLLTSWLRGEAGMSGFAVPDMYDSSYMSKVHEVLAGKDIPDNYPGTSGTVTDNAARNLGYEFADYGPDGSTPIAQVAQALRETAHRILYTVLHSRGMDGISNDTIIVQVTPWWSTLLTALIYTFAVLTVGGVVVVVLDIAGVKFPKKKKKVKEKA
ncbi:MAG: glycoside hydrolase family 3 C-terminal domain-containing protein [Lachnospiraceae bacterium]|nr:glycoside hydrolase family 3 C-terminal domain-containing protein [Lachnospiraceae bacterium]